MTTAGPQDVNWSSLQRGSFRLLVVYFVLTFFPLAQPQPILYPEWFQDAMIRAWQVPVDWVSVHVLHSKVLAIAGLYPSDTPYAYIRSACTIGLAVVVAIVWSLLDRRQNYRVLHGWTRVWLRYVLAFVLLDYGLIKVIKLQFPDLQVNDLIQTYGASSPNTLLENFMGFSTAYSFFGGAGELLAAALLFFRRTTTLGALVAAAVLSNVVMLNYSYYFGALLFSLQLFFIACFLLAPDLHRLANLLIFNRPTQTVPLNPLLSATWMRRCSLALKVLVIGLVLGDALYDARDQYASELPPTPPHGLYAVTSFQEGGKEVWDGRRWATFGLGKRGNVWMHSMDDATQYFTVNRDPLTGPFTITPRVVRRDPHREVPPAGLLRLVVSTGGLAKLEGTFEGNRLKVSLRLMAVSDFPLMSEQSHLIKDERQ